MTEIDVPNDVYLTTAEGQQRLYYATNGRAYFKSGNGFEFRKNPEDTLAVITDAGNLGIGTATPVEKLEVIGTTKTLGLYSAKQTSSVIAGWGWCEGPSGGGYFLSQPPFNTVKNGLCSLFIRKVNNSNEYFCGTIYKQGSGNPIWSYCGAVGISCSHAILVEKFWGGLSWELRFKNDTATADSYYINLTNICAD